MPSRNSVKIYGSDVHYHVYNRGVAGQPIFNDPDDYTIFLNLLKRHLDEKPAKDFSGRELVWLGKSLELEAYCLMPNHFHLLIYQIDNLAMPTLMKALSGAYTRYFNKRYKRFGPIFQGVYKASPILNDTYLAHITRYIHMNPKDYFNYPYSSIGFYLERRTATWFKHSRALSDIHTKDSYAAFLSDYDEQKDLQAELKSYLANS